MPRVGWLGSSGMSGEVPGPCLAALRLRACCRRAYMLALARPPRAASDPLMMSLLPCVLQLLLVSLLLLLLLQVAVVVTSASTCPADWTAMLLASLRWMAAPPLVLTAAKLLLKLLLPLMLRGPCAVGAAECVTSRGLLVLHLLLSMVVLLLLVVHVSLVASTSRGSAMAATLLLSAARPRSRAIDNPQRN